MNEEDDKAPEKKPEPNTKPIPRSQLTEMRHREIANDAALKRDKTERKKKDD